MDPNLAADAFGDATALAGPETKSLSVSNDTISSPAIRCPTRVNCLPKPAGPFRPILRAG